jgi:hypothetical protein
VFAVLAVLAGWRGSVAKAKRTGAAIERGRIAERTSEAVADAGEARRRQEEINRERAGVVDERDPNLRD